MQPHPPKTNHALKQREPCLVNPMTQRTISCKTTPEKKTYVEVTQTPCMQELRYGADARPVDGQPFPETNTNDQMGMADTHPSAKDEPT